MKTSLRRRWALSVLQFLVFLVVTWGVVCTSAHAEKFSTAPQRQAVDNAINELDKATDKAGKAQQNAPTDGGQQGINAAEDAADAARDAANRANDAAEKAREEAADKAKTAKTKEEVKDAREAEKAAKEAADRAREAEKTAKDRDADAKKAVDDQVKADEGKNKNRRIVHEARQAKRDARRRLADRVRELQRTWSDTKRDPQKNGVTITEEERRATERKVNEGRRDLGLGEVEILAERTVLLPNTLTALVAAHQVQVEVTGTGKTIGHVATMKVKNLTSEKITVLVPPMMLESQSGKHQHYVCPRSETIALNPKEEQTYKARGICVSRSKPPVGENVGGDLVINDGSSKGGGKTKYNPAQVDKLVRCVTSYYDGADKLEKEGKLSKVPYKDPEMRREIVTQWGVWSDPRICTVTKEVPATKEDLTKTVYRQTEEHTPVTPEIKKKLDTGITDIFTSIQLTSKEAKELEPASPYVDISDDQTKEEAPRPAPQEREETIVNIDGSKTTTRTRTDPDGTVTTTTTTEYKDETTRIVTVVKHPSGAIHTQTTEPDGSTKEVFHGVPDKDGKQTDTTIIIDKATDTKTNIDEIVEADGTKTVKRHKSEASGKFPKTKELFRETVNPDGSKETFHRVEDGSWTRSTTDKNGKVITFSSGDGKGGTNAGTNGKGKYTVEKRPDGSLLVHWDLPNGTGGTKSFSGETKIVPDPEKEGGNPLPFKVAE